MKRLWPHLVAAFVVFHVAASCIDVIPDPSLGMNKKAWAEPRVRYELDRWARRFGVPADDFRSTLWDLGMQVMHARGAVVAPVHPYLELTGQRQAWAMFVAGSRFRERFEVRARACARGDGSCDWEVLYLRGDDVHAFLRPTLEHARVRSATFRWGWPQSRGAYERGCRAIALRAMRERPELVSVECRFEREESPNAEGTRREAPTWGRAVDVDRAAMSALLEALEATP